MEKILIVDDEPFIRENVLRVLGDTGYQVLEAATGGDALEVVAQEEIDLVLLDLNLGTENGIDVLREMKLVDPDLLVIIITGYGTVETAVEALKLGAFHYMKKPFKADALRVIVKLALQASSLKREVRAIRRGTLDFFESLPMVGTSPELKTIFKQVRDVAQHPDATVLITGESGTGKELVAKGIHHFSARREAPFIAVNCASLPLALLESELFGHEKGAFTDAKARKPGLFEAANKGTLFLDEVGEMDPVTQAKFLRVLENRQFRRVGGTRDIEVDVRVIAATNRNLRELIREGRFRDDLYYRLSVFPIHIPPLRERRSDIAVVAAYYLEKYSRDMSRGFEGISPAAARLLEAYSWPGNIRELKNVMEKICIMHRGPLLLPEHLPPDMAGGETRPSSAGLDAVLASGGGLEEAVGAFERQLLRDALSRCGGNVLQAASLLKIPRGTLRYKLDKYGLSG
uniref:Sigma-54-dependent Fis family transcriptional regulator n=1 Tax=Geobacter metallireducens TaxID=28232 RepID=A0A831UCT4_GEOME